MEDGELLFVVRDPTGLYTVAHICALLRMAQVHGHPLDRGSYLEHMTIAQLDALVHGRTDA